DRRERRHIDRPSFGPTLHAELGQLHALCAFEQVPAKRTAFYDMTEEQFPFDFERVVVNAIVGHFLPRRKEIDRLRHIGIPYGLWRRSARLDETFGEPGDGRSERAIDVKRGKVV